MHCNLVTHKKKMHCTNNMSK